MGRLQFALRNSTDGETVLTTGATISKTLASFRPAITKKAVSSPTKKKRKKSGSNSSLTVQVIKGNEVEKVQFRERDGH
jgi:hypothetical protein